MGRDGVRAPPAGDAKILGPFSKEACSLGNGIIFQIIFAMGPIVYTMRPDIDTVDSRPDSSSGKVDGVLRICFPQSFDFESQMIIVWFRFPSLGCIWTRYFRS